MSIARARRKGTKSGLAIGRASHRGCRDRAGAAWGINSHRGGGDRYQRWGRGGVAGETGARGVIRLALAEVAMALLVLVIFWSL